MVRAGGANECTEESRRMGQHSDNKVMVFVLVLELMVEQVVVSEFELLISYGASNVTAINEMISRTTCSILYRPNRGYWAMKGRAQL